MSQNAVAEPYRVKRLGWPPGPWDAEPDDRWEDRHLGFPVLAVRNHLGAWCGYVGVPPGHPWHGGGYGNIELECHGGLTYSAPCSTRGGPICHVPKPGEPDEVWWFGFDTAHIGDRVPGMDGFPGDVYRTLAYVQEQTRAMATAAAAAR